MKIKKCQQVYQSELGQPTHWTHSHLFDTSMKIDKQVTPGLTYEEFEQRRLAYVQNLSNYQRAYFSSKLSEADKLKLRNQTTTEWQNVGFDFSSIDHNFIAIIPSAMTTFMAPDVPHTFKQNSDFLYLTGFKEPNSVLVISRTDDEKTPYKTALFVREKNPKTELWEGPCTGPAQVPKLTGIKDSYAINEFKNYLNSLMKEASSNRKLTLWRYPSEHLYQNESGPNCINDTIELLTDEFVHESNALTNKLIVMNEQEPIDNSSAASYFNSSRFFVQYARIKKSPAEIQIMRDACEISSKSFVSTMRVAHPFINESLIYSKFEHDCRIRGSEHLGKI